MAEAGVLARQETDLRAIFDREAMRTAKRRDAPSQNLSPRPVILKKVAFARNKRPFFGGWSGIMGLNQKFTKL